MRRFSMTLFLVMTLLFNAAPAQKLALVGGHVINPEGRPSVKNAVVLIDGNRIAQVGPKEKIRIPDGFRVVDVSGKWLIPGLVDGHVHFFQSGGLYTRPDVIDLRHRVPYEQELRLIRERLPDTFARYLRCGVTGVVDVGGPFWNFEVRALAQKTDLAPRVVVAGPLVSTYQPEALTTSDPPIIRVDSIEEALQLVRRQVEKKTDLIKIWYIVRSGQSPEDHFPMVKAVIDESHRLGVRVAVHATQLATAKAAVRAGADILVHSVNDRPVDAEFIDMLKRHKVLYTPTLVVWEGYREVLAQQVRLSPPEWRWGNPYVIATFFDMVELPPGSYPKRSDRWVQSRMERLKTAMANLKTLQEAGVLIVAGTDAGNIGTLHGPAIFREFELMAEAGLTPGAILTAATSRGAMLMGREKELGAIAPEKLADIVVLHADPLQDIRNTAAVAMVIKNGRLWSAGDILQESPQDLVQRQLNAYNGRDLEAFLDTYASDIEIYNFPDSLRYQGIDALRRRYGRWFARNPQLHARLVNRITLNGFVIDREEVTGLASGDTLNAVAIYSVKNGKIRKVWFIRGDRGK